MTRARLSLTLCEAAGSRNAFVRATGDLALRTRPQAPPTAPVIPLRVKPCSPEQVVLSWPGYFGPQAPIHRAIAALRIGDPLQLRPRADGKDGWELANAAGLAVGRMARSFKPPVGVVTGVRVAAIQVRHASGDEPGLRAAQWEIVLPEIEYQPDPGAPLSPARTDA